MDRLYVQYVCGCGFSSGDKTTMRRHGVNKNPCGFTSERRKVRKSGGALPAQVNIGAINNITQIINVVNVTPEAFKILTYDDEKHMQEVSSWSDEKKKEVLDSPIFPFQIAKALMFDPLKPHFGSLHIPNISRNEVLVVERDGVNSYPVLVGIAKVLNNYGVKAFEELEKGTPGFGYIRKHISTEIEDDDDEEDFEEMNSRMITKSFSRDGNERMLQMVKHSDKTRQMKIRGYRTLALGNS